jgi:hypothetical protein
MRGRLAVAVAGVLMASSHAAVAAEAAPADAEFLEYLGSWDGDDADWQLVAADAPAVPPPPKAATPKPPGRTKSQPAAVSGGAAQQEQQR